MLLGLSSNVWLMFAILYIKYMFHFVIIVCDRFA